MAAVDPTINDPTPTGRVADRSDVWKVAARCLRDAGIPTDYEARDVLHLAEFLAGDDFGAD